MLVPAEKRGNRTGADGTTGQETGHKSLYPWEWLATNIQKKEAPPKYSFWGAEIAKSPPAVHYDEIMASDAGVGKWTAKIVWYSCLGFLDDIY
jgi:hypothetical protein